MVNAFPFTIASWFTMKKKLTKLQKLRKENKELKIFIEDQKRRIRLHIENESEFKDKESKFLEESRQLRMLRDSLESFQKDQMHLEGMISVLKRVSGLYEEEILTPEEYRRSEKLILSNIDLPF